MKFLSEGALYKELTVTEKAAGTKKNWRKIYEVIDNN